MPTALLKTPPRRTFLPRAQLPSRDVERVKL
jgi:hypothetical protein